MTSVPTPEALKLCPDSMCGGAGYPSSKHDEWVECDTCLMRLPFNTWQAPRTPSLSAEELEAIRFALDLVTSDRKHYGFNSMIKKEDILNAILARHGAGK